MLIMLAVNPVATRSLRPAGCQCSCKPHRCQEDALPPRNRTASDSVVTHAFLWLFMCVEATCTHMRTYIIHTCNIQTYEHKETQIQTNNKWLSLPSWSLHPSPERKTKSISCDCIASNGILLCPCVDQCLVQPPSEKLPGVD